MKPSPLILSTLIAALGLTGCTVPFTEKAKNGIVLYCPGAGNYDLGDFGVRDGLRQAGFQGDVASIMWTVSFNPAIDQALRINARLAGARLAGVIEKYIDSYPGKPISLIGLSAGSGVAIWALEDLKPGYKVDNVVLLASSLYYRYDVTEALKHVKGNIYNFHSPYDAILKGPMKIFGTIDGRIGVDGAGAVGLQPPRGGERVVNMPHRRQYHDYGNHGGHTDATNPAFVQKFISPLVMNRAGDSEPQTTGASPRPTNPLGAAPG